MTEETTLLKKATLGDTLDSSLVGVSIRAWLAVILVVTVCSSHIAVVAGTMIDAVLNKDFAKVGTFTTVGEPLYSMAIAALGFYFGQKVNKP